MPLSLSKSKLKFSDYAKLIRINPSECSIPSDQISIQMKGLQAIKMLFL